MSLPRNKKLGRKPNAPTKLEGRPKVPVKKGNTKPAKKPAGKQGGGSDFFGAVGGYKGVNKNKVKRLTNGLMREETRGLRKQQREVGRQSRRDSNAARRDYARGVGDLNYVHGETTDYIGGLAQRNQQNQQNAMSQQAQAQAALMGMLGDTYSGAQSGASQELARLGIQGGGSFQQLNADQANAQNVAAQSGTNAQTTLGMAGQNSAANMQMLQGMNQGSMMQGIGQNLNARNDALGTVRDNRIAQQNEVRTALQEARATRKDLFFQLLQQLQQTGWDQYVQQRNLQQQDRQLNMQQRALKKSK
jgi:hypothetical protein